jgi:hypothetical protein
MSLIQLVDICIIMQGSGFEPRSSHLFTLRMEFQVIRLKKNLRNTNAETQKPSFLLQSRKIAVQSDQNPYSQALISAARSRSFIRL